MSRTHPLRKRLFVDLKVQGTLAFRVVFYWGVCLLSTSLMCLCWRALLGPIRPFSVHLDELWYSLGLPAIASLILLPMIVMDVIRESNRFAGPILRLRRSMQALARGEHVEPIRFRKGDFWQEFADDFNAVLVRMQRAESHREPLASAGAIEPSHELEEACSAS